MAIASSSLVILDAEGPLGGCPYAVARGWQTFPFGKPQAIAGTVPRGGFIPSSKPFPAPIGRCGNDPAVDYRWQLAAADTKLYGSVDFIGKPRQLPSFPRPTLPKKTPPLQKKIYRSPAAALRFRLDSLTLEQPMQQATASTATPSNAIVHSADADLNQKIERLESQLRAAQRMATIGELASTTTHEFNNLLMTVVNYAKLGMRHKDDATRDKAFQRISDAAQKATRVAGSVLALSRTRTQHGPVALVKTVENAHLLLEREFRKYRVDLEIHCEAVPAVMGDENELQRVLINLLVNARQATPEGGSVSITLRHDQATNEVVLGVRDSGKGIAPEVLPRIFEPFFSTKDGPDSSGKGGTGVGLSSCKEAIDKHSGRIRVESAVGKGTAFIIRLPAAPQS